MKITMFAQFKEYHKYHYKFKSLYGFGVVKWQISPGYFMWWCHIIDYLKFKTRPSSLRNLGTANTLKVFGCIFKKWAPGVGPFTVRFVYAPSSSQPVWTQLHRSCPGGAEDSRIFRITIIAGNLTSHPVKNGQKCRAHRLNKSPKIIFKWTCLFRFFEVGSLD